MDTYPQTLVEHIGILAIVSWVIFIAAAFATLLLLQKTGLLLKEARRIRAALEKIAAGGKED